VRSKSTSETLTQVKPKAEGIKAQASPPISEIVKKIQVLESSSGLNNYSKCKAIGKWNRSGYGIPGNGTYRCFDTQEEEDKTIGEWFKKKLAVMTLEEALKIYCPENPNYITNFLSLNQ
jgi:hypothetical protein